MNLNLKKTVSRRVGREQFKNYSVRSIFSSRLIYTDFTYGWEWIFIRRRWWHELRSGDTLDGRVFGLCDAFSRSVAVFAHKRHWKRVGLRAVETSEKCDFICDFRPANRKPLLEIVARLISFDHNNITMFLCITARRARVFYEPRVATPCDICEDSDCTKVCATGTGSRSDDDHSAGTAPSQFRGVMTFIVVSVSVLFVQYFWYAASSRYFSFIIIIALCSFLFS